MNMGVKNFEDLYQTLGQQINYSSKQVADVIDVEAFRRTKKVKGKNYQFDFGPVSSILEAEGATIEQLCENMNKTIGLLWRENVERAIEGMAVRNYSLNVLDYENGSSDVEINVRTEDQHIPEEDHRVYSRLVAALTQRAARDREAERQKDEAERGKIMKLRDFKRTLNSMKLDDTEKTKLIEQFNETHNIK